MPKSLYRTETKWLPRSKEKNSSLDTIYLVGFIIVHVQCHLMLDHFIDGVIKASPACQRAVTESVDGEYLAA